MLLVCVQAMKKLFFIAYFFLSLEIYTFLQGEKKLIIYEKYIND